MRQRIYTLVAITLILCGCKSSAPTAAVSQETPQQEVNPVAGTAAPEPRAMTESMFKGKSIYENRCANCHKLFDPKEVSREDWVPILKRMQHKAKIEDADMVFVNDYVLNSL